MCDRFFTDFVQWSFKGENLGMLVLVEGFWTHWSFKPGFHYTTNATTMTQKQSDYTVEQSSFTLIALFWLEIGRCCGRNWLNGNQALVKTITSQKVLILPVWEYSKNLWVDIQNFHQSSTRVNHQWYVIVPHGSIIYLPSADEIVTGDTILSLSWWNNHRCWVLCPKQGMLTSPDTWCYHWL